jgi:signal peptidase II
VFLIVGAAVLVGDLTLKAIAFGRGPGHEMVSIVPGVLGLECVFNRGAIFGVGQGRRWFFVLASVVAAAVIVYYFWRSSVKAVATHIALALILAGALGNLYDRLWFGYVRDMLHLFPGVDLPWGWHWPVGGAAGREVYPWVFNVADVALLAGVILVAWILWRADARPRRPQSSPPGRD